MSRTALNMKKLIEKKYYTNADAAMEKLDLLMLASRITDEEYTDLIMLIEDVYAPVVETEPEVPPVPEEVPNI